MQVIVLLLAVPARLASEGSCEPSKTATTELGTRSFVQDTFPVAPDSTVYSSAPLLIAVKWIRAQVRLDQPGDGHWRVDVRDQQFRPIDTILPTDFSNLVRFKWTPRIYTPGFFLDIWNAPQHLPQFTVLQYIVMPEQARSTYYSLKVPATPDWRYTDQLKTDDTDNLNRIRMADAVGLFFSNVPARGAWSCSGVLVAPDLFLTNWHCGGPKDTRDEDMWTPEIQEDAFIDLSWDGDRVSRELRVVGVPSQSKALDYALLRVEALDRVPLPIPATIRLSPPKANEPVVLIHHPDSDRKAISLCNVADVNRAGWLQSGQPTEITYNCDTEGGSSGAPVFGGGAVLALHHLGFTYGTNCTSDMVNKGIKINEIVSALPKSLKDELQMVP
jgi:hypothetical protein